MQAAADRAPISVSRLRQKAREAAKLAVCWVIDAAGLVTGRRDPLVPPTRLMFDGPRGVDTFKRSGRQTLDVLIQLGELKPSDAVLDVGSGIGRKSIPMAGYLSRDARYEGLEIVKAGVDWCVANVTSRFPNFRFRHVDIYNRHYNPKGKIKADEYRFPFQDASFDFALLTSVFTHMLPEDVRNYVSEIARVLRPGGRTFVTYYLLNDRSKVATATGRSAYRLAVRTDEFWAENPDDLEEITALDEGFIKDLYERSGLAIREPIHYGPWPDGVGHGQDIVVAVKR